MSTPPPDARADRAAESDGAARSELRQYLNVRQERRKLFPSALLVGALAGSMAVAFRIVLSTGEKLRGLMVAWSQGLGWSGVVWPILWGTCGAVAAVWLTRRFAPEAAGSGIPHLEAVLHRLRRMRWRRLLPVKFAGGALALTSGLALGREGPTVQIGAATGAAVSDLLRVSHRDRQTLIASGGGAGLAAAFNAPLSGLVFVLEEVQRDFRPMVFGASFLAAATANIIARAVSGQFPVFTVPAYPVSSLVLLPAFALVGILTGVLGATFNKGVLATLDAFGGLGARKRMAAVALVGALVGVAAYVAPTSVGGGHDMAEEVLYGRMVLWMVPLWLLLRFGLTLLSYGTDAPGGIFAPLLVLGALTGLGIGLIAQMVWPGFVPYPGVFAVVGMGACFAAVVRAPLTGIVLILEMTGNYAQMLPLLVACFFAYVVADKMGVPPLYEALLERDVARRGVSLDTEEPAVVEFEVQPGAPFAYKYVRELGLPPGCVLVACRMGDHEWIPTASTLLEPHVRITAVIAPEAENGFALLREGCEG